MTKIKPYTYRNGAAPLPIDVLDALGARTWIRHGNLVVFADTAAHAAVYLDKVGICARPRELKIATGNEVKAIIAAGRGTEATVLAWLDEGGDKPVVEVNTRIGPERRQNLDGHFVSGTYQPMPPSVTSKPTSDPATELAAVHAALVAACDGPDAIPDGATTLDMVGSLVQLKQHYYNTLKATRELLEQARHTTSPEGTPVVTPEMLDAAALALPGWVAPGLPDGYLRAAIAAALKAQVQP